MKKIDARNMACPKPVIETKKALKNLTQEMLVVIVDNETAVKNLSKLLNKMGNEFDVKETGEYYELHIQNTSGIVESSEEITSNTLGDKVILISSDAMGNGSKELGKILMKGYIYTLKELDRLPKAVLFVNAGVRLTTENEEVIEDLRILADQGVEVLSCGTCLDYLNLADQLAVGDVTNMFTIVEYTNNSESVIKL